MGPRVVEGLRSRLDLGAADVRLICLPQLDITLVPEIQAAETVIFVDARADESDDPVTTERIEPAALPVNPRHTSHTVGMQDLLRMALDWYGAAPSCYAVMPKGYDFSLSETLSPRAQEAAAHAQTAILEILKS